MKTHLTLSVLFLLFFFCGSQKRDKNYNRFSLSPVFSVIKKDTVPSNCTVYEKINIRSGPNFFLSFSFTTCVICVLVLFRSLDSLALARTHTHTHGAVRGCQ